MKKQINLQLAATLGGGLLFNFLFWMEGLALNLLIYSVFILTVSCFNIEVKKDKKTFSYGLLHLVSAMLLVYNHSTLTITAWYFSLAIFIGFAYHASLRGIFTSVLASAIQLIYAPINFALQIAKLKLGGFTLKPFWKTIKYVVAPMILVVVFASFYSYANETFARYLGTFFSTLSMAIVNCVDFLFGDLSPIRFLHLVLGLILSAALFIKYKNNKLVEWEMGLREALIRKRKSQKVIKSIDGPNQHQPLEIKKNLGLKVENLIGILSFAMLDIQIFFFNIIEISTSLAQSVRSDSKSNYSSELHEGTNALIGSIIVAMAVILFFFRGNLNFYRKNKTILTLTYVWIAQNILLVASVFLKDYNYIAAHGLTYKRIGVIFFLTMCLVGLSTVYFKVAKQRTLFYLLKTNGLVWYLLLLTSGVVNWDRLIVWYNIRNSNSITTNLPHLFTFSDDTLPLLNENKDVLEDLSAKQLHHSLKVEEILKERMIEFEAKQKSGSWLSWNYRDWQTQQYITAQQKRHQQFITKD